MLLHALPKSEKFAQQQRLRLREQVAWGRSAAEEALSKLTTQMAQFGSDASLSATKKLGQLVRKQATVMSIADVFFVLTILFLARAAFAPLMRKPKPDGGGGSGQPWAPRTPS